MLLSFFSLTTFLIAVPTGIKFVNWIGTMWRGRITCETPMLFSVGFHHWLGSQGMPRRYADYLPTDGFTLLNAVSSIGAFVLGASTLPFIWNVARSHRFGRPVTTDDPWGFGGSLGWATSCPPPRHNFIDLPRVRSFRPAIQLHYPHLRSRVRDARDGPSSD